MSKGNTTKVYVVFEGRIPGIYFSWRDVEAQVSGYKNNCHQSYEPYNQAESKWMKYCVGHGRGEAFARSHIHRIDKDVGSSSSTLNVGISHNMGLFGSPMAEDTSSPQFIIQDSMQKQLQQVCTILKIHPPNYTLHEVKLIHGRQYLRYYSCLDSGVMETPLVCVGRFAKDDYDGKEDVAALLLQKLLLAAGKQIRDFNYYNVGYLQGNLQRYVDENLELRMQMVMLKEEMRQLKSKGAND
ncbi:Ribonuclease H1, N-terminal [Spatholobus suberectus]|nr:Ribonuclease H1, N-terminal [Spatholobus suberectus]